MLANIFKILKSARILVANLSTLKIFSSLSASLLSSDDDSNEDAEDDDDSSLSLEDAGLYKLFALLPSLLSGPCWGVPSGVLEVNIEYIMKKYKR